EQENRRRRRTYERRRAHWSRTYAELQAMVSTACSYTGMPGMLPGIELRSTETLLWTSADAGLVRARFRPIWRPATYASFTGDLLGVSGRPDDVEDEAGDDGASVGSAALAVWGTGTVAVTDERVLFIPEAPDRTAEEWSYRTLQGLASPTGH